MAHIDALPGARPTAYMVNCVHPAVFRAGLARQLAAAPSLGERVVGLQANTSRLSPEDLDGRTELDSEPPDVFAWEYGFDIIGTVLQAYNQGPYAM